MKKSFNNYIDSLVKKIINETIEERADELVTKLTEGDKMVCDECGSGNMYEGECKECGYIMSEGFDSLYEGENICEQCGGEMTEGICEQCASMNESDEFDYVAEEEEFGTDPEGLVDRFCNTDSEDYNEATCKYHKQNFMGGEMEESMVPGEGDREREKYFRKALKQLRGFYPDDEHLKNQLGIEDENGEMEEELHGNQKKIDVAPPKGKITGADFKKLRSMKRETDEEMEEGNAFSGALDLAREKGQDTFKVGGKTYPVKESKKSIQMTESQMVEFIEKIVLQEEEKLKYMGKTKGLNVYQKAHTASGKENKEYLQSVVKKMKDYLKDGSKGEYDMNPDIFPKGNGELAKMDKKAYIPSDAVQDYTDNLTAAGLENLDYDEIHPNEDWVTDNVEGSSRTGNNPEWANTGKSDVNKKRNKVRKDNMLAKIKRKAYNKAPQPILQDKSGDDSGSKLMMKLESTDEKTQIKINEEFDRMKNLMGYNQKTQ